MASNKKINKNIAIANKIIEIISSSDFLDWQQGWDPAKCGLCKNAETGLVYRGLNFLRLYLEKTVKGYGDNRWLTYRQAQNLGGSVKPGQKATEIAFYSQWDKKLKKYFDPRDIANLSKEKQLLYMQENVTTFLKSYYLFNVEQCTNLKLEKENIPSEEEIRQNSNDACDKIINNSEAKIYDDGLNEAYYSPTSDSIHTPPITAFNSMDDYYATVCHEIIHSTGHESRLNRKITNEFGSPEYAFEELIAELGSLFIQAQTGIKLEGKHINNHAAYLKNWLDHTKEANKPYDLVKATSAATKASDYVIKKMLNKEIDKVKSEEKPQTKSIGGR